MTTPSQHLFTLVSNGHYLIANNYLVNNRRDIDLSYSFQEKTILQHAEEALEKLSQPEDPKKDPEQYIALEYLIEKLKELQESAETET